MRALEQHVVVTFKTYFWWEMVLHNPHHAPAFAEALGRDETGVIRVWETLGPLLFRPAPEASTSSRLA